MKKRIMISIIAIVIICAGIGLYKVVANMNQSLDTLTNMKIEDVDLSKISDGKYTGKYEMFPVSAVVDVTVKAHQISKIDLIKHVNGKGTAAESIPDAVVKTGSLKVDAVSGATYSSKVILKAIENALNSK